MADGIRQERDDQTASTQRGSVHGHGLALPDHRGREDGSEAAVAGRAFADRDNAWLVVASNGGSSRHPSWYHNLVAHPDQVWIEVAGRSVRATVEQLDGSSRDAAWQRVIASQPRFAGYQKKTDRALPVIRLTAAPTT